jgi:hypothetical protein
MRADFEIHDALETKAQADNYGDVDNHSLNHPQTGVTA